MLDIFSRASAPAEQKDVKDFLVELGGQKFLFSNKLEPLTNLLNERRSLQWVSEADWSMHELLAAVIGKVTGPAVVHLSSYAFSETPAKIISELVSSGLITGLHCLIDSRVDIRSASAHTVITSCCTTHKMADTHAKVTLLKNDDWTVSIVGSANYTSNKRYEAGTISLDPDVYLFHHKWITDAINKH